MLRIVFEVNYVFDFCFLIRQLSVLKKTERSDTIILGILDHFRHFRHFSGLSGSW